jgi:hypothetical protein
MPKQFDVGHGVRTKYGEYLTISLLAQDATLLRVTIYDSGLQQYRLDKTTRCKDVEYTKQEILQYANRFLGIDKNLATDWALFEKKT